MNGLAGQAKAVAGQYAGVAAKTAGQAKAMTAHRAKALKEDAVVVVEHVKTDMTAKKELPGEPVFTYPIPSGHTCETLTYHIKRKHTISAVCCPSKYDPMGRCRRSFLLVNRLLLLFAISTLPWSREEGFSAMCLRAVINVFVLIPITIPLDYLVACTKPPEHTVRGLEDTRPEAVQRVCGACLLATRCCAYPVTIFLAICCIVSAALAYHYGGGTSQLGVYGLSVVLDWVNQVPTLAFQFWFPYPWCKSRGGLIKGLDSHKRRYSLEAMAHATQANDKPTSRRGEEEEPQEGGGDGQ